jgi:predicted metal-dependent hydrolase
MFQLSSAFFRLTLGERPVNEPNQTFRYTAKRVEHIIVRPFNFKFPENINPRWIPGQQVRSHLFNGMSLTMPYLEPFLVQTLREAALAIDNKPLQADIRQFNGQEASHYKCHRQLNDLLKHNGYPSLEIVEALLAQSYLSLSKKSLRTKLAYSAGFECMTNGFTHWMINRRRSLFPRADRHITSFWLMHMVEETEHKTVAFDAYMAYSGAFWPRAIGVLHGSGHVVGFGLRAMWTAIKEDGNHRKLRTAFEMMREVGTMFWNVAPYLLRALSPNHNPRREGDPQWMKDWVAGHAMLPEGAQLPLIDTSAFDMPVPFNHTNVMAKAQ